MKYFGLTKAQCDVNAWIGFYKQGSSPKNYECYTFLRNLTDNTYDIVAPDEPGSYFFMLFKAQGYSPTATSSLLIVEPE